MKLIKRFFKGLASKDMSNKIKLGMVDGVKHQSDGSLGDSEYKCFVEITEGENKGSFKLGALGLVSESATTREMQSLLDAGKDIIIVDPYGDSALKERFKSIGKKHQIQNENT